MRQEVSNQEDCRLHAKDQNLIEENEAKAKKAEGQATELAHQAHETTEPAEVEEAAESAKRGNVEINPDGTHTIPPGNHDLTVNGNKVAEATNSPNTQVATTDAPQALSPSNLPLDLENLSLKQINFIGQTMAKSGMFPDVTDGAKALVKILAGKEIGVTPFQAMTSIHIIKGKATMGAHLMAAQIKGSGKYDYRVMELTNDLCSILFKQRDQYAEHGWSDLGRTTFTIEDAKRAELVKPDSGWVKYPQAMLFARAISAGCRTYTPDVFKGNLLYVPEEMGAQVNEDGELVGRAA